MSGTPPEHSRRVRRAKIWIRVVVYGMLAIAVVAALKVRREEGTGSNWRGRAWLVLMGTTTQNRAVSLRYEEDTGDLVDFDLSYATTCDFATAPYDLQGGDGPGPDIDMDGDRAHAVQRDGFVVGRRSVKRVIDLTAGPDRQGTAGRVTVREQWRDGNGPVGTCTSGDIRFRADGGVIETRPYFTMQDEAAAD